MEDEELLERDQFYTDNINHVSVWKAQDLKVMMTRSWINSLFVVLKRDSAELHRPSADLSSENEFIASERETWDDTSAPQREAQQGYTSSKESQHDTNKHDAVRCSELTFFFCICMSYLCFTCIELNQLKVYVYIYYRMVIVLFYTILSNHADCFSGLPSIVQ